MAYKTGHYLGKVCQRHPELNGLRRANNRYCVDCDREATRVRARGRVCRTDNGADLRMQRIKQATPPWADKAAIRKIYVKARELGLTVDHIYPLRGKTVSGLHVENNLQLLTQVDNDSKGNKFGEDHAR